MRDHEECENAYHQALAKDRPGYAEFILTRCDNEHGRMTSSEEDDA